MYEKNLTEDLRLRLSSTDMDFLRNLSADRGTTISECIRSILAEYRRSVQMLNIMQDAVRIAKSQQGGELSSGDTKTNLDDQL